MVPFRMIRDKNGKVVKIETPLTSQLLLDSPKLNKGTAFTKEERKAFNLVGRLPDRVESLEEQVARRYQQYCQKESNLQKNIFLNSLHDLNETLYYKLISDHIEEMMPIIYTPTEALAIENYSSEIRKPRGLYLCYNDQDHIDEILENRLNKEINLIVVTDAEQILGIGDQGVGGIAISVAKLAVYTLCAHINPHAVLPIQLDVGTNNQKLLDDECYVGWRHERITGEKYDVFIEKFVSAVKRKFPNVYLHWEDFGKSNARRILEKYQDKISTFNDDMQGTGAVTLATLLAATKRIEKPLKNHKIVMFGGGTAGVGIADQLCDEMVSQGLTPEEAHDQIYLVDKNGLMMSDSDDQVEFQKDYLVDASEVQAWDLDHRPKLLDVVQKVKPSILIGASTAHGAFTEEVVKAMAVSAERPIILPLSNPISKCEAEPKDILAWTNGKALIATGSPFDPVTLNGQTYITSECNNALIYPGIGVGVIASKAKRLTKGMIRAACYQLSELSPVHFEHQKNRQKDPRENHGALLVNFNNIHEVSRAIGRAVAEQAIRDGVAGEAFDSSEDLESAMNHVLWEPKYYPYVRVE